MVGFSTTYLRTAVVTTKDNDVEGRHIEAENTNESDSIGVQGSCSYKNGGRVNSTPPSPKSAADDINAASLIPGL
jgi:hypothetical protein